MFVFSITWLRRSNAVSIKSSPPIQGVKNEGMLEPMSIVSAYASYLRHIWKFLFSMEDLEHGRIKCILFFFLYILSSWDMTRDPALFSTYARAIQLIFKSLSTAHLMATFLRKQIPSFFTIMCAHMLSRVWLFMTPWTVAHQVPLSMKFSKQKYWSGAPFPTPEDLPNPRIEPVSVLSPALAGGFFTTSNSWEAKYINIEWMSEC